MKVEVRWYSGEWRQEMVQFLFLFMFLFFFLDLNTKGLEKKNGLMKDLF